MLHPHHHIRAAFAVTTALAAGVASPAIARVNLNGPPSPGPQIQASTNLCSEVCSGAGYGSTSSSGTTVPNTADLELGARLPHAGRTASVALRRTSEPQPAPTATVRVVSHDSGFDWGDAAIGAGGTIVVLLALGGGAYTTLTRRERHLSRVSAAR